jgi:AraC-like DNA-binding protein
VRQTETHLELTETTIDGPRTRRWVLEARDCPALAPALIGRLGIEDAAAPYERVRLRPRGSFIMMCLEGQGRVWLDGRWQTIGAGWVCLAPPRVPNAFHAVPGRRWRFCWLRYEEAAEVTPLVSATSPVRVRSDVRHLARPFEGLRAEWEAGRDPKAVRHWIELIHLHARRLAEPWHREERLRVFWEAIAGRLPEPWTLRLLSRAAHVSGEHLRRLCHRELGRSPMAHLTSLRVERAQELLRSTTDKLEVIAREVGYRSALVFARAFRRWVGCSPSEYRRRR